MCRGAIVFGVAYQLLRCIPTPNVDVKTSRHSAFEGNRVGQSKPELMQNHGSGNRKKLVGQRGIQFEVASIPGSPFMQLATRERFVVGRLIRNLDLLLFSIPSDFRQEGRRVLSYLLPCFVNHWCAPVFPSPSAELFARGGSAMLTPFFSVALNKTPRCARTTL